MESALQQSLQSTHAVLLEFVNRLRVPLTFKWALPLLPPERVLASIFHQQHEVLRYTVAMFISALLCGPRLQAVKSPRGATASTDTRTQEQSVRTEHAGIHFPGFDG
jgi:hypothetical protein